MKVNVFLPILFALTVSGCSSSKNIEHIKALETDKPKIFFGDVVSTISKLEIRENSKKALYKIKTSI